MRKLKFALLSLAFVGAMTACGNQEADRTETGTTAETVSETVTDETETETTQSESEYVPITDTTEEETETEVVEFDYDKEYVLKDIYADDFLIGSIYNGYSYNDETLTTQFNVITAENAMKPESTQPSEGYFTFNNAKEVLEFANMKDMLVHGHVLCWHQQTPSYMGNSNTREVALQQLHDHIYKVVTELSTDETIISWDVVNEAIDDGAKLGDDGDWHKCLRSSQWTKSIGYDFIEYAFQYAEEAINEVNPDIKLYYNDYNLDQNDKAKIVVAMVKDLQSQGIRIDGVGMQGHYNTDTSASSVANSIDMFRDLGVEVSVSELDVCVYSATNGTLTQEQEIQQAQKYAQLFQVYKDNADIISRVIFWGHMDGSSWRSEYAPCIYDKQGNAKEAFYAVADPDAYLAAHPITDTSDKREANAANGTPVIDGEIDDVWNTTTAYSVNKQLTAWEGATGTVRILWDDDYIYVLMEVTDSVLNNKNSSSYQQDSIELYLDQQNDKTGFYGTDDGQYRVSYTNSVSYGTVPDNSDGFISATTTTDTGYIVEAAIPLMVAPYSGREMGFDCQINDANSSGERQSIAKFCDSTDNSFQNTENWGTLILE